MDHLRDALLSPSPKGLTHLNIVDDNEASQQDIRESTARDEFENPRGAAFHDKTWIITERYCSIGDGADCLESYLHSLWHIYCQLARNTSHETGEHDRLVLDILRIQGRGPLTRPVRGLYGIDIARTVEGTLWNDLPFLVPDMTEFWLNNCATLSGAQRLNLASYLAKLASTRVSKDRLCQIALVLFRSTFEDRRELYTPGEHDDENTHRQLSSLDISHLLPSACEWIKEAGHNIVMLSDVLWNDCPSTIGHGGQWFLDSELGKRSPTGFTPLRWMYWLKRLHEIQDEARAANQVRLDELVTDAIERMVDRAKECNSEVLRAYENGGEELSQDKDWVCLVRKPRE